MKAFIGPVVMWTAIAAVIVYVVNRLLDKLSPAAIAAGLKEGGTAALNLGVSAGRQVKSTVDDTVSTVTGREETFGGWLAEMIDPNTRLVRSMLKDPVPYVPPPNVPQTPQSRELKPVSSWWEFWK